MVRSKRYKLIEYIGMNAGQLFDLENDPDEVKDLWNSPDHKAEKEHLQKVLSDWFVMSTVRATGWWKDPAAKPQSVS
jgi:hypothetical protein